MQLAPDAAAFLLPCVDDVLARVLELGGQPERVESGRDLPDEELNQFEIRGRLDIKADPSENYSVAATHPQVAKAMRERLASAKAEFAPYRHKDIPPYFKTLRQTLESARSL